MSLSDIGLIGLAVMGQNLALNIERNGYTVSVYNRSSSRTQQFLATTGQNKKLLPTYTMQEFVLSLTAPRKIILMVQAGAPVDEVIGQLLPLLSPGDLIIDGGNSYYQDTIRRCGALQKQGIHYMGVGISGGEEGALNGPSIMPGGPKEAWLLVQDVLTKISAKAFGADCCDYIGPDGAGHYVKMTHNGIEYGDMQLIAESYTLLSQLFHMSAETMSCIFKEWNTGVLESYLIEITGNILAKMDEKTGKPVVDIILDKAGQKGTGKWTSQDALELGVAAPTIAEAVFARCISADKTGRVAAADILQGPDVKNVDCAGLVEDIHNALYASKICSYAQGFALLRQAALQYGWQLDYGNIALLWRGGCIIRAGFLDKIKQAYERNPNLENLLLDPFFASEIARTQGSWRKVVALAVQCGVPVPSFASALSYYDAYRSARGSANLIQAQRDYFGAHTYERIDEAGTFHTQWF